MSRSYFVAIDETREHLEQLGFERRRISVSGIPIDPVFLEKKDKRAMRTKHALDPDRLTILISAGGFGLVPMDHIAAEVCELIEDDAGIDSHPSTHKCGAGIRAPGSAGRKMVPSILSTTPDSTCCVDPIN